MLSQVSFATFTSRGVCMVGAAATLSIYIASRAAAKHIEEATL